jgi:hypothetical protein
MFGIAGPRDTFISKAVEWQQQAIAAANAGRYAEALDCAQKGLSLHPEHKQLTNLIQLLRELLDKSDGDDDAESDTSQARSDVRSSAGADEGSTSGDETSDEDASSSASSSSDAEHETAGTQLPPAGTQSVPRELTELERVQLMDQAAAKLTGREADAQPAPQVGGICMPPASAEQWEARRALRAQLSNGVERLKEQAMTMDLGQASASNK